MNILLSIKPEYTQKIFSGEKKYEFRKQRPVSTIDRVFIYECAPSKNIVGWFTVKKIISGSPKDIWDRCKNSGGIERKEYFAYCNGKNIIYALEIDSIFQFGSPINPFEISSDFRAPQNFSYLDRSPIFNEIKMSLKEEDKISEKSWFTDVDTIKSKNYDIKAINPNVKEKVIPKQEELIKIIKESQIKINEDLKRFVEMS